MKRVSFEIAKKIREIGYPQSYGICYHVGMFEEYPTETSLEEYNSEIHISAPTYIGVWLWLEREGVASINLQKLTTHKGWWFSINNINTANLEVIPCADQEYAIVAAITYLLNNNILK